MQRVQLKLDLSKIDKSNLFKTEKGSVYLDCFVNIKDDSEITDKDREYKQGGFVSQKFQQSNAKNPDGSWVDTPIIGNVVKWFDGNSNTPVVEEDDSSDLPF